LFSGILAYAQPLNFYIQKGLENSPLLKDFSNQLVSGKLDSMLILASYKPQINQVSQAMYAPNSKNFGYDEAITNGANYAAMVGLEQSLFNQKAKNGHLKLLALLQQTIEADRKITVIELKQAITEQYLAAYADGLQIEFNRNTLNLLKEEQAIVKPLAERGIYAQTDLINLSLSISAQNVAIQQAHIQYRNNLSVLNYICGIAGASAEKLEKPELIVQKSFNINNSPALMKFRIDSLKNLNNKEIIDLNYRPKISAFADAGFQAIRPENIPHNIGTSFGLNFVLPIYDGQQRKLQYEKTTLAENSRQDYQAFYTVQYRQQVNRLIEQLKLTDELISGIGSQLAEQEKLIALYKIEIEKGLVRFLDFLNAVNNYAQIRNSLTVSEMNRLQIINQMNYLK
jgi:outer membrane protein TolC